MKQAIYLLVLLLLKNAIASYECNECECCKGGTDNCIYYNMYQYYCKNGCSDGFHGQTCRHACRNNCLKCSDINYCSRCSDGYFGYYCSTCPNTCATCTSGSYCNKCRDGFYSDGSNYPYYNDCRYACKASCKTCSSYSICTVCKDGFYNGKESARSTDVYYDCRHKCLENCKSCTSYDLCNECNNGFYNGKKYPQSDIEYNDCRHTCRDNCKSCTSYTNCTECYDGYYVANNWCYKCNYNCKSCSSYQTCTECIDGKYNDKFTDCREQCKQTCKSCRSLAVCTDCITGWYGTSCQNRCSHGCKNHPCDANTGNCACKTGFMGDKCDTCVPHKYGTNCENQCSTGCLHGHCKDNGECYSCKTGFIGNMCNSCMQGKYGQNCDMECPSGCANSTCKADGDCYTCKTGFDGNKCNQCEHGKYGADCNVSCSVGCEFEYCNKNGDCDSCKDGFTGYKCDKCIGSKYGHDCSKECPSSCIDCVSQTDCLVCKERYWGDTCLPCPPNCINCSSNSTCESCESGFYGLICDQQCHSNCRNGRCDKITGTCSEGCINGFYGNICHHSCSPNCINSTCDGVHGECLYGCKTGYNGTTCSIETLAQTGSNVDRMGVTIGAAAGGGLFLVIVTVVLVVVILFKKRRRSDKSETNDIVEVNDNTDNTSVTYSKIKSTGLPVEQQDADAVYAMPNKPKKNVERESFSNGNTSTQRVSNQTNSGTEIKQNDTTPSVTAKPKSLHDNAVRGSFPETSTTPRSLGHSDESALEIEEDIDSITTSSKTKSVTLTESDTYYNVLAVKKRKITLDQLPDFVSKKTKAEFTEEFQQLPPGLIKPFVDSQKRVNLSKNRYKRIYPYDETRVLLKEGDSDYINASYLDGYNKRKAYIASIGPTYKYMGDMSAFWIMVWQENVGKIVMLTKLDEGEVPKCDQYWPDKDFSLLYANVQVTCQSEEIYADYTLRSFTIHKDSEKRKIVQVHFTAWPDKGVPDDVTSLIKFRQKVISTKTDLQGPTLVHCSAGIGRTGTYIALDSLTEEGEAEGEVDIYAFVRNMREQRVNMVQTAEQYQYLHNALVHTLTFDSKAVEASKFDKYITSYTDDHLREKFEKLQASVEQRSDDEVEAVKRNQALRNKNRVGADIPGDRNRPKLYLERKLGSSDYMNAVYVNSYTTINRYLVAQTPLPDTVVDFLTLIVQEKVSCIVSMEKDSADDKTIGAFYPADNQTLKKGTFTVKSKREKDTEQYVLRKLEIAHKGKSGTEDVTIPHIQFTHWNEHKIIPEEPAKFVQFVKDVEMKYGGIKSRGPILVHCLTGAEKSGLFCVVSNLLEKTQIDQETSVVNAVRQIKYRRHMSVPNKDQYIFCHQCVNEYLRTFDIYSNFELKT